MGNEASSAQGATKPGANVELPQEIDLSGKQLRELPATSLSGQKCVDALRRLVLDSNELETCKDWSALSALTRLEHLSIAHNRLPEVPDGIERLCDLVSLSLAHNNLRHLPASIGRLVLLGTLDCGFNALRTIPEQLASCASLTSLDISNNLFETLPDVVCSMENLSRLVADSNSIRTVPSKIKAMKSLTHLNLSGNYIGTLPKEIGALTNLGKLYISNNELISICPEIGNLESLREIDLSSNRLIALPPAFAKLENLRLALVDDNPWHAKEYQSEDLHTLMEYVAKESSSALATRNSGSAGMSKIERQKRDEKDVKERKRKLRDSGVFKSPSPTGEQQPAAQMSLSANMTLPGGSNNTNAVYAVRRICGKDLDLVSLRVQIAPEVFREKDGAFVVMSKNHVYAYVGDQCSRVRGAKATHLAGLLQEDSCPLLVMDYSAKHKPNKSTEQLFWSELTGNDSVPKKHKNTPEEDKVVAGLKEMDEKMMFKLFCVRESERGRVDVVRVAEGRLSKKYLVSESSFVLDDGVDVWVWAGRFSSSNERNWAYSKALEIIHHSANGDETNVLWAADGGEDTIFAEHFYDWLDSSSWAYSEKETEELLAKKKKEEKIMQEADQEDNQIVFGFVKRMFERPPSRNAAAPVREAPTAPDSDDERFTDVEDEEEGFVVVTPTTPTTPASPTTPTTSETPKENAGSRTTTSTSTSPKITITPVPDKSISQEEIDAVTKQVKEEMRAEGKVRSDSSSTKSATTAVAASSSSSTTQKKGRFAVPKRKAPTKNPLRDRKEREERNELASTTEKSEASQAGKANAGAAFIGGYGVLYAAKADEYLFAKRKGRNTEAELLAEANKKNEEESYEVVPKKVLVPKDLPRLILVKGRRRPFCKQVERTWQSLNSGDCFVLDEGKYGKTVYQWNGRETNRIEKGKAMDVAKNIRDKERFNSRVVIVDEGREPPEFWTALGGAPPAGERIAGQDSTGDDEEAERVYSRYVTLYEAVVKKGTSVTSSKGTAEVTLENVSMGKKLVKSMLFPGHCYILDCMSEIYVWTDTQTSGPLRRGALISAGNLAEEHAKQCWVAPVYHEWAGAEQVMFRERFWGWNTPPISVSAAPAVKHNTSPSSAVPIMEQKVNVPLMYSGRPRATEDVMVDDGTGSITVYLVEEFHRIRLEDSAVGEFYSGDSYVVLYRYVWKNKDCYLIYFWQGRSATVLNKGTSAALTAELDDKLKATIEAALSKEVRVVQGKEPRHFLTIFSGKFIVHDGRDPRTTNSSSSGNDNNKAKTRMYHISGTDAVDTHAVEKSVAISENLSSSGVFWIIDTANKRGFTWIGRYSNEHEKHYSETVAPRLEKSFGISFTKISEGSEPSNFWSALGYDDKNTKNVKYPHKDYKGRVTGRLFVCSVGSGAFNVEEIGHFSQDDLDAEDAIILDAHDTVFVWMGSRSHPAEQRLAMDTAVEYCQYASGKDSSRPKKIPCLRVMQNEEPLTFTSVFHGWQEKPPRTSTTTTSKSGSKQPSQPVKRSYDGNTSDVVAILSELSRKYSYEDLLAKKYPKGIDESALENYLEDEEFEKLFKMSRAAFAKLPMWQKVNAKRAVKLW